MNGIKRVITIILAIGMAFSIPTIFIYMNNITHVAHKVLKLEISPQFTGGENFLTFNDSFGDDKGEGALTYPLNPLFPQGSLDLVRYKVYEPVTNAAWTEEPDYWQFEVFMASLPEIEENFFPLNLSIYLDIDGADGGSTETLYSRAELISFSPEHPWDFAVTVQGAPPEGKIVSHDGLYTDPIEVYLNHEDNSVMLRLPLKRGGLLPILDGRASWHYVVTGGYSPLSNGGYLPVKKRSSLRSGGGSSSRMAPKIYDLLTERGVNQQKILSAYDESSGSYAVLEPVEVSRAVVEAQAEWKSQLGDMEKRASEEKQNLPSPPTIQEIRKEVTRPDLQISELFLHGYEGEARKLLQKEILLQPENPILMAYQATFISKECNNTESLSEKTELTYRALDLFEEGLASAENDEQRFHLWINRGNVIMYLPEAVFKKALTGAEDLAAAGAYLEKKGPSEKRRAADFYFQSGLCYEKADLIQKAEIQYIRALSINEISDQLRYELGKRGYF